LIWWILSNVNILKLQSLLVCRFIGIAGIIDVYISLASLILLVSLVLLVAVGIGAGRVFFQTLLLNSD
jgi:hypothetical protein